MLVTIAAYERIAKNYTINAHPVKSHTFTIRGQCIPFLRPLGYVSLYRLSPYSQLCMIYFPYGCTYRWMHNQWLCRIDQYSKWMFVYLNVRQNYWSSSYSGEYSALWLRWPGFDSRTGQWIDTQTKVSFCYSLHQGFYLHLLQNASFCSIYLTRYINAHWLVTKCGDDLYTVLLTSKEDHVIGEPISTCTHSTP